MIASETTEGSSNTYKKVIAQLDRCHKTKENVRSAL
jgi:hypothetical protein